jgi:hypothetical protein
MGLLDTLRSGIKTAHKVLKTLEAPVTYQQVSSRDAYGAPVSYGGEVSLTAIVDFRAVPVRGQDGITVYSSATLTFLDLAAIETATGGTGFAVGDSFVLADGTTGKVLSLGGFMDPGTTRPLPTTVMLG